MTYQKVNSSIVSKGARNSFNEMFPLAVQAQGGGTIILTSNTTKYILEKVT